MCVIKTLKNSYQKRLKSQKHSYSLGQMSKIHCSLCNIFVFRKGFDKLLQSDKHLDKTGQKIRCDKCQIFYDRNHQHDCQKVECDICKHILIFFVKGNMNLMKAIVIL